MTRTKPLYGEGAFDASRVCQAPKPHFDIEESVGSQTTSTATLCSHPQLTPDSQESQQLIMDAAESMLTKGALVQITQDNLQTEEPIVQCVQIKPMASQNGAERFRVVMSDSLNFMQGMLGQRESERRAVQMQQGLINRSYRAQPHHPR